MVIEDCFFGIICYCSVELWRLTELWMEMAYILGIIQLDHFYKSAT